MTSSSLLSDLASMELSAEDEAVLEDMADSIQEAGDWRDHLPYQAALDYHESAEIRDLYQEHVDTCDFCQRLIDTLHPDLNKLHSIRVISDFVDNPDQLAELERSNDPHAKIKAADIYFSLEHPELAYERIGEGLAKMVKVEASVLDRICHASQLPTDASATLAKVITELRAFHNSPTLEANHLLRLVEIYAQLGRHTSALSSLCSYLVQTGVSYTLIDQIRNELSSISGSVDSNAGNQIQDPLFFERQ